MPRSGERKKCSRNPGLPLTTPSAAVRYRAPILDRGTRTDARRVPGWVPGSSGRLAARLLASVAQLVEHLICNQAVAGSSPTAGPSPSPSGEWSRQEGATPDAWFVPWKRDHWMTRERRAPEPGDPRRPRQLPRQYRASSRGSPPAPRARRECALAGRFPSGQRGQTVNLMAQPSQVRILLSPPPPTKAGHHQPLGAHPILCTLLLHLHARGESAHLVPLLAPTTVEYRPAADPEGIGRRFGRRPRDRPSSLASAGVVQW